MKRGIVIVLAAMLLSGCEWMMIKTDVEYRVTGNVPDVSITIENASGGTSQYDPASLPWTYTWTVEGNAYTFLYVSAQNNYSSGTITTSIYLDGDLYRTSTSSGAYVIATASGSIGDF